MASSRSNNVGHSAGIFADMTVDGPEIGTLVIVFDRAKNLPNRRSMGKQNPYCAARLGKEAKKTETDVRGGQTPKWDQELRFVVHDSPDYQNLKISLFSEDKKTDLIGEAWVSLTNLIVPGGGKKDLWQGLTCKGKYAGELRIEMTYFDSRPKPEAPQEASPLPAEELRQSQSGSKVKRRPLPSNPVNGHITPDTIPGPPMPGRARHGPRDYRTPPRANSMPPETHPYQLPEPQRSSQHYGAPQMYSQQYGTPPHQYYTHSDPNQYPQQDEHYQQADFLPQLPPSNRQRAQLQTYQPQPHLRPQFQNAPMHAHSAPAVPMSHHPDTEYYDDDYQLNTDYPEPLPDVDHLHDQMHQDWHGQQTGYDQADFDPYSSPLSQPQHSAPPPPPMHQTSSPAGSPMYSYPQQPHSAPRYGVSPPAPRQHYMPSSSPASNHYQTPIRTHPPRGGSIDGYASSPDQGPFVTPPNKTYGQTPSPAARSSAGPNVPHRHSIAEPYGMTPPRPHPLSQEVSRARSPQPYSELPGSSFQSAPRDGPPLIKPRPVSPAPPSRSEKPLSKAKSSYSIQHPVRAFESSAASPLSQPIPRTSPQPPLRKSVSPRPTPPSLTPSGTPYGPDSFDVHNPNSRPPAVSHGNSPHNPYQIRPGTEAREEARGPIVGWHGQEIDPSDHLPVDSWAPEPEKKTPTKTYGLGRDRDFGPRTAQGAPNGNGRISRDLVVNLRTKTPQEPLHLETATPPSEPQSGRNKLVKKNAGRSPVTPLGEHHNYNPTPSPHSHSPAGPQYGGYSSPYHHDSPGGYGAPHIPPKIPLQHGSEDALAREIQSIDIGESRSRRGGSVPPPTAYMPVRSHRDRQSFY